MHHVTQHVTHHVLHRELRSHSLSGARCYALCTTAWRVPTGHPNSSLNRHQMLLMEEIRKADITYHDAIAEAPDGFEGHTPLLMDMLKALLSVQPQQRLRVRDLRRHPFLTNRGEEPLGEEGTEEAGTSRWIRAAAKGELREAVARVIQGDDVRKLIKDRLSAAEVPGQGADCAVEEKESEQGDDKDKAVTQT